MGVEIPGMLFAAVLGLGLYSLWGAAMLVGGIIVGDSDITHVYLGGGDDWMWEICCSFALESRCIGRAMLLRLKGKGGRGVLMVIEFRGRLTSDLASL